MLIKLSDWSVQWLSVSASQSPKYYVQWRIQDFPEVGPPTSKLVLFYKFYINATRATCYFYFMAGVQSCMNGKDTRFNGLFIVGISNNHDCRKLHENERILTPSLGGGRPCPPDQPMMYIYWSFLPQIVFYLFTCFKANLIQKRFSKYHQLNNYNYSGGSRIFQMGGRCFVANGGAHILFSGKKCMKLKEIGLKWGGARLLAPCYSKITIFLWIILNSIMKTSYFTYLRIFWDILYKIIF